MSDQSRWQGQYPRGNGRMAGMIFGVPRKRPEGLQRIATGALDWLTGDKWDFDQRGGGPRNRDWDNRPTPPWGPGPGRSEFPHYPAPMPTPPIVQPPLGGPEQQPSPPLGGPEQKPSPPLGTPPFYPTPDGKPIPTFPEQTPPIAQPPVLDDGPQIIPPQPPLPDYLPRIPTNRKPGGWYDPSLQRMEGRGNWGSYQAF